MTVIPLRQTQSLRPVVRRVLLDQLHLLRSARHIFFDLLHFLGRWTDDLGVYEVWDSHLGAGGVPAGRAAFSEQIFDWPW